MTKLYHIMDNRVPPLAYCKRADRVAFAFSVVEALVNENKDRQCEERIAIAFGAIQTLYVLEYIDSKAFDALINRYVKFKV